MNQAKNLIKGGFPAITAETGAVVSLGDTAVTILSNNPLFMNDSNPAGADGIWKSADDGLNLRSSSPALDLGLSLFLPVDPHDLDKDGNLTELIPVDLAGYDRIQRAALDLGAYEAGESILPITILTQPSSVIQLREIFTGRINNWTAVGGKDAPINVYIGPPGDGITNTWSEKVLGDADTFTPRARNAELEQRITGVGADPLGITYLATESLKNKALKVLSVDKVMAGADSVLSGRYTLMAPLMFVTREKPALEVQKFLQFVNNLSAPISNSVFALPAKSAASTAPAAR